MLKVEEESLLAASVIVVWDGLMLDSSVAVFAVFFFFMVGCCDLRVLV